MSVEDYSKAYKMGRKDYQMRMLMGKQPTLDVLDDILPPKSSYSEMPLGLVQIPVNQIAGTRSAGRSNAFASNFMPIMSEKSEFAAKWIRLSISHEEEGIRDPVKAYEYMNRFYILEGNKRVSVLKYFGAVSIPGNVIRLIPKRTNEKENKIYYEFLDFYDATQINDIYFSQEGSFPALIECAGKKPGETWTDDEKMDLHSLYTRFCLEYEAAGGSKLPITEGDAFLSFISLYGYETLLEQSVQQLHELITSCWEEFELRSQGMGVELKMDPSTEKKNIISQLLPVNWANKKLKVAFVYEKQPSTSAWTYAHELGRLHLEQTFPDEIVTVSYCDVTQENADQVLEQAIAENCDIIFTTTPPLAKASVRAATLHPKVRILNCSLGTSHRYIRTYYARMHEAKFLMGAIGGSLAENNLLAYVADYPIYGTIANINAFALGAKLVNPRARVKLVWKSLKDQNIYEKLARTNADCIAGQDMLLPDDASRCFGLYQMDGEYTRSLAMPLWHWGKFYEKLIRTVMDGTWKRDDDAGTGKAINYWWGMSSGMVDVVFSKNIPIGTKRLVELLKQSICTGAFSVFGGILYSQDGIVQDDPNRILTPDEIVTMDWLAENVIGTIPKEDRFDDRAKPVISQQGVDTTKG